MDCLKAQELISSALDRELVDAAELEQAKQHCRTCEECATFIAGLLALQKATPPQPSPDFTDNVMTRLRAEKRAKTPESSASRVDVAPIEQATVSSLPTAATSAPAASPQAPPATNTAAAIPLATGAGLYALVMDRVRDPRRRREVIAWTATAAVVLIAAGFAAMAGMRAILIPRSIPGTESTLMAGSRDNGAAGSQQAPTFGAGSSADMATKSAAEAVTAPDLVVLNSTAYRLVGPASDVTRAELTSKGSVRSSLAAAGTVAAHDALGSADPAKIYIESAGDLLAFERVTRSFNGATYVLQSGPIDNYGQWPTWSSALAKPVTETGSPSFSSAGADASGLTIFKPLGSSASAGIAVPANAPTPDPIAGAPDWTWWTPLR